MLSYLCIAEGFDEILKLKKIFSLKSSSILLCNKLVAVQPSKTASMQLSCTELVEILPCRNPF